MFPPLDMADWSVIALGAVLGGLVRGFTSFGFAMIFMPLAASAIPPATAIAVIWVIDAPFALLLGARAARQADARGAVRLLAAATLTIPIGLYLVTTLDRTLMRWLISGLIALAVLLLISGWRYRGRAGLGLTIGVGAISGLFSGLASLGGMPIALFWLASQARRAAEIRADLQLYFGLATFVSGAFLWWNGLLTKETFALGLVLMPVYGAMLSLGARGFHLASEVTFRRIAYAIILGSAILSLPVLDGWLR